MMVELCGVWWPVSGVMIGSCLYELSAEQRNKVLERIEKRIEGNGKPKHDMEW